MSAPDFNLVTRQPANAGCAAVAGYGDYEQLLMLAVEMAAALEGSYDANEWPADGTSRAEQAAEAFREWQKSHSSDSTT